MPDMHQLGRKYQLQVSTASGSACAADVQNWDFHWQRMYFYDKPPALDTQTVFKVTCDYDTTSVTAPVSPGWGTSNEKWLRCISRCPYPCCHPCEGMPSELRCAQSLSSRRAAWDRRGYKPTIA